MRLYATVASERATKGQGGNQFLDIKLLVSKSEISAGRVVVVAEGLGARVYYIPPAGNNIQDGVLLSELSPSYISEKQKGENGDYLKRPYNKFDKPEIIKKMLDEKAEKEKGETCEECQAGYCEKHGTIPM